MKSIIIRLPDVEAAMLVEVQKVNKAYKDLQGLLIHQIQQEYQKTPKARAARWKTSHLNQIPDDWHQIAVRFRRANGIRDGDILSHQRREKKDLMKRWESLVATGVA